MAPNKRASMREGPLAQLFRKTDEEEGVTAGQQPAAGAPMGGEPRSRSPHRCRPPTPTPQDRLRCRVLVRHPGERHERPAGPGDPYARNTEPHVYSTAPDITGQPVLRVVGVGGGGVNAVNRMVEAGVNGVEFLALNTDLQSLQQSSADATLHIGAEATRGLGSGSNPDLGRQAAMDDYDKIKAAPARRGHGLHHGRRRWRHGDGRGARRRADRP